MKTIEDFLKFLPLNNDTLEVMKQYENTQNESVIVSYLVSLYKFDKESIKVLTSDLNNKSMSNSFIEPSKIFSNIYSTLKEPINNINSKISSTMLYYLFSDKVSTPNKTKILSELEYFSNYGKQGYSLNENHKSFNSFFSKKFIFTFDEIRPELSLETLPLFEKREKLDIDFFINDYEINIFLTVLSDKIMGYNQKQSNKGLSDINKILTFLIDMSKKGQSVIETQKTLDKLTELLSLTYTFELNLFRHINSKLTEIIFNFLNHNSSLSFKDEYLSAFFTDGKDFFETNTVHYNNDWTKKAIANGMVNISTFKTSKFFKFYKEECFNGFKEDIKRLKELNEAINNMDNLEFKTVNKFLSVKELNESDKTRYFNWSNYFRNDKFKMTTLHSDNQHKFEDFDMKLNDGSYFYKSIFSQEQLFEFFLETSNIENIHLIRQYLEGSVIKELFNFTVMRESFDNITLDKLSDNAYGSHIYLMYNVKIIGNLISAFDIKERMTLNDLDSCLNDTDVNARFNSLKYGFEKNSLSLNFTYLSSAIETVLSIKNNIPKEVFSSYFLELYFNSLEKQKIDLGLFDFEEIYNLFYDKTIFETFEDFADNSLTMYDRKFVINYIKSYLSEKKFFDFISEFRIIFSKEEDYFNYLIYNNIEYSLFKIEFIEYTKTLNISELTAVISKHSDCEEVIESLKVVDYFKNGTKNQITLIKKFEEVENNNTDKRLLENQTIILSQEQKEELKTKMSKVIKSLIK